MKMHKLHTMSSMVYGAMLATGVATAAAWVPLAHAQEMEFAQKSLGGTYGEENRAQFRSTIIDPARSGKSLTANANNLRIIPFANPASAAGSKQACGICGVVESIRLSLNNDLGAEPDDDSSLENTAKHGKGKARPYLTDNRMPALGNGGNSMNKPSKKPAPVFEIKVRMTDGTMRIVNQPTQPEYAVGDYVRVISGAVTAA
jgi:hypothetical protein